MDCGGRILSVVAGVEEVEELAMEKMGGDTRDLGLDV